MRVAVRFRPADANLGTPSGVTTADAKSRGCATDVFDSTASQAAVINAVLEPHLVKFATDADYNCVFLAYGQTGSGKTHTIFGPPGVLTEAELSAYAGGAAQQPPPTWGMLPYAAASLLQRLGDRSVVEVSAVEVYLERVYDLLNDKARVAPPGASVRATADRGNTIIAERDGDGKWKPPPIASKRDAPSAHTSERRVPVHDVHDVVRATRLVEATRAAQAHAMNARSSRSHCIITLHVRQIDGSDAVRSSQFQFVDLAGSERVAKSGVVADGGGGAKAFNLCGGVTVDIPGTRMDEARSVNTSLSALGRVIAAMARRDKFITFRESTLTQMLKPALTGSRCHVCVMLALRSEANNDSETQSTLRFGAVCASAAQSGGGGGARKRSQSVVASGGREAAGGPPAAVSRAQALRTARAALEQADKDIEQMRAQGLDEHVNEGFAAPTVKGFLDNKRKFEDAKHKVSEIKQRIAEMKAKSRHAAGPSGTAERSPEQLAAEEALASANNEVVVYSGLFYRQVTTGIWTQRNKRMSDRMIERDRLAREVSFLSGGAAAV